MVIIRRTSAAKEHGNYMILLMTSILIVETENLALFKKTTQQIGLISDNSFRGQWRYITMKRLMFLALAIILSAALFGCSDSRPLRYGEQWGSGLKFDEETALKKLIVKDVLGGILTVSVDPNVILPPPSEETPSDETEMRAISINASIPAEDRTVEGTYVFQDEEHRDALTITAEGNKEVISRAGGAQMLIKYSPLKLRFEFDQFVFTNGCGFRAYVDGVIECRINGKFDRRDETFKGSGSCKAGMSNLPEDLIYVFEDEEERAVKMGVNVYVDGDFFNLDSYRFTGMVHIDGRMMSIEKNFNEQQICTPLAELQQ